MLSIVVPTFNQADDLPGLISRVLNVIDRGLFEIIVADDNSTDDTVRVCGLLAENCNLTLLQTSGKRDLSRSVVEGVISAKSDEICVMNADLSHPPETIPLMLEQLHLHPDAFVLGSRYVPGNLFDTEWSLWRLLAKPLCDCHDPTSGYFVFDRRHVDLEGLRSMGIKIGLELMVRGDFTDIVEVPIDTARAVPLATRPDAAERITYLRHLRRLYLYKYGGLAEFLHFGMVGASGFVIDIIFYFGLQYMGLNHIQARAASFWPAVSWNWALNRLTTFGERQKRPRTRQWLEFVGSSLFGFALNWGAYSLLTTRVTFFDEHRVVALIVGILLASFFNFAASTLFVYSESRSDNLG